MLTYVIDLDGTLAQYKRGDVTRFGINHIGEPIPGALEFVKKLADQGGKIVIFTVRLNYQANDTLCLENRHEVYNSIVTWLNKHGFSWDEIYTGQGKPDGTAFIDDRAVQCRPQEDVNAYEQALAYINTRILGQKE